MTKKINSMEQKFPRVYLCILVKKDDKILLSLLTKNWLYQGKQVYGVPGRDLNFREKMGDGVKRIIKEEIGAELVSYKVISVNANYEYDNHYIGIGVAAKIKGEIKLLQPDDWEKWEWIDLDKIPNNLFPAAKDLIQCYKENKFCVSE